MPLVFTSALEGGYRSLEVFGCAGHIGSVGQDVQACWRSAVTARGWGTTTSGADGGWFVALGIVLIAMLGLFALGRRGRGGTLASVIFIGAMLLVGGIFQIIHAFLVRGWGAFAWQLLGGVLYVVGGLLIMDEPVQGSLVVTLFLVAALIVGGVMRVTIGLRHRDMQGWWLLLLGGAVSLIVAGISSGRPAALVRPLGAWHTDRDRADLYAASTGCSSA